MITEKRIVAPMLMPSEVSAPVNHKAMVQYGVWKNCTNHCDFCLLREKRQYTHKEQVYWLDRITDNIRHLDFVNDYPYGVSLLGGELFYIRDEKVQAAFMRLVDTIIERVLTDKSPHARFSTVTNGIYKPDFLFKVVDRLKDAVGIERVDVNFSYDLKYRYHTEKARQTALQTIRRFQQRYDYRVGVQMILTQHVINEWKARRFSITDFMARVIPGCQLSFLYPHPIHTGKTLPDFQFKRADFLAFIQDLKVTNYEVYHNFINSTKNSGTFKYTGLKVRFGKSIEELAMQKPVLTDGKEILTDCGHSVLYRCYADSDRCVLCDLEMMDGDLL